ncbi:MAG: hypothetical protein HYU36_09255 [Planctomycetes bacterium]|nr:hypothetical protein [Planctomycetota bacterium]
MTAETTRVFDFTLPKRNSLRVENWFNPSSVITYYGKGDLTPGEFEKYARFLQRYRHPCFPFSWQFAPGKILIIEEPDGSLTFDFTPLNAYLEISYCVHCLWR